MGVLDIIYNMVNKSRGKKSRKKSSKRRRKSKQVSNSSQPEVSAQRVEEKVVVKDLSDTNKLLKAWQSSVRSVSDHPLSQVKIINSQVLDQLTDILSSMNSKLDKLSLLDEVLSALKESRSEVLVVGGSTKKIDKAISRLEGLTIKDEEVIRVLNNKGPQTAESLSQFIGISRSTASSRLNRLEKRKIVRKKADGKLIHYSLYSKKNA